MKKTRSSEVNRTHPPDHHVAQRLSRPWTARQQNAVIVAHSPLSFAHSTDDLRNTDIVAVYR